MDIYDQILRAAHDGWQRGLTAGAGGNISARVFEGMLITKSGSSFRTLSPSDLLLTDMEGKVLEGEGRPSIETEFHGVCYALRPDVNAIYHIHSPYGNYFAAKNRKLPLHTVGEKVLLGKIPLVPYEEPGSTALAMAIATALREHPGCKGLLLAGHGMVAFGETVDQAYDIAECMEAGAKLAWLIENGK